MALRLSEIEKIKCPNGGTLISWLGEFKYCTGKRIHVVINDVDRFKIRIYTARNCYGIVACGEKPRENDEPYAEGQKRDYLGCIASTRTPRPGEDWTRGNDLPDGSFCKRTFHRILGAIVFYEALEVAKDIEPITEGEEHENLGPSA